MDFDDLIMETVFLLQKNKEIREKYQNKFKYIMVDEYQDTNRAQYGVNKGSCGRLHKNLVVVGDDDQSIYNFRGADLRRTYWNLKRIILRAKL